MRKRFHFDVQAAIKQAWDLIWVEKLKERSRREKEFKKTGRRGYRYDDTYYTTASDVESQVRRFARETAEGKAWGSTGLACGREGSWTEHGKIRLPGGLNGAVRNFLLRSPGIVGHNFGRGHISGMRFRPADQPMSPTEANTMTVKERRKDRPRPRHYAKHYGATLLCMQGRKRSIFSRRRGHSRTTSNKAEVTCPRCLKLLKELPEKTDPAQGHPEGFASRPF